MRSCPLIGRHGPGSRPKSELSEPGRAAAFHLPAPVSLRAGAPSRMGISIVNGYLCTCSCDVAKAKLGQDPHPPTQASPVDAQHKRDAAAARPQRDQPAVVLGGSLGGTPSGLSAGNGATGASNVEAADAAMRL